MRLLSTTRSTKYGPIPRAPLEYLSFLCDTLVYAPGYSVSLSCLSLRKIKFPGITTVITITLVHMVLVLRVVALYSGRTLILVFLAILLMGEISLMPIPIYIEIGPLGPPSHGCLTGQTSISKRASIFWTIPLFVDTIILILTLNKSRQYAKQMNTATPIYYLLKVCVRDGILYYVILGIIHGLNSMLLLLAPLQLKTAGATFMQPLATVLASRLVFNLRKQASLQDPRSLHNEDDRTRSHSFNLTSVFIPSLYTFFNVQQDIPPRAEELMSQIGMQSPHHTLPSVNESTNARISIESIGRTDRRRLFEIQMNELYSKE
ncbi:hypothetical protein K439DRAFT_876328 [Ramaria rubella]|nr:hypothetical protein K439DRAFT_876328 [Ramaria rubella]